MEECRGLDVRGDYISSANTQSTVSAPKIETDNKMNNGIIYCGDGGYAGHFYCTDLSADITVNDDDYLKYVSKENRYDTSDGHTWYIFNSSLADGKYTVKATNKEGVSSEQVFIKDTETPKVTVDKFSSIIESLPGCSTTYNCVGTDFPITVTFSDNVSVTSVKLNSCIHEESETAPLNQSYLTESEIQNGFKITQNGFYMLIAYDEVGYNFCVTINTIPSIPSSTIITFKSYDNSHVYKNGSIVSSKFLNIEDNLSGVDTDAARKVTYTSTEGVEKDLSIQYIDYINHPDCLNKDGRYDYYITPSKGPNKGKVTSGYFR